MADEDAAQRAMRELNGASIDGQSIKVDIARPKRPAGEEGGRQRYSV